ncbi:pirin family protein [Ruminococcaceae bacterium OttesenSCG-928-A16]|nr:pirin family protein [Ruminococcaceae bacterium OttesenSCG-928-A16]
MADRKIKDLVRGQRAIDGAGVHLVRVLGRDTAQAFDPFLMLDSFDSENPADYTAGFPFHPHRGIETITYLIQGEIDHEDSLGNKGTIKSGQSQWMTAGSGIMHQEMPQASPRMLGLQLWLNLPQKQKMAEPRYFDITSEMIGEAEVEGGVVRVISGQYAGAKGVKPYHVQASIYDVALQAGASLTLPTKTDENVFVFLIDGDAVIDGQTVASKTAVLFGEGDAVTVAAPAGANTRFIFCSGKPLHEGISWGGPIVMNSREELDHAFEELRSGEFIKHKIVK